RRRVQKFGIQGQKRDHIEMCWRATDLLERKFGRKRGHREVRLDRIGGADLCDIGCKCERLDAVFTQCTQRKGSNPLRDDIAAGGDEQRIVRELRYVCAERLEDLDLWRGVGDVILTANDVRDSKLDVVDDRRQRVEETTVLPDQYGIGQRARIDLDAPVQE